MPSTCLPIHSDRTAPLAWFSGVLLLAGVVFVFPHGRLHEFGTVPWFLMGAGVMVSGYFLALRAAIADWRLVMGVAILARGILLFQTPGDDIFRYVWEGRILVAGWNPYLHAPDAGVLEPLRNGLWDAVQHKTFTAIYPPLTEWIFAGISLLQATPFFYKLVFVCADLAAGWVLVRRFGVERALWYLWNPLVIYSFAGGGHYDALFVLALVFGWAAWLDGRRIPAAAWLGAAVALKWMALPLLAWAGWRIFLEGWKSRHWSRVVAAALAGGLPFAVAYAALGLWTGEWTLQLAPPKFSQYARSAEFLPGIVGWFWEQSQFQNHWFLVPLAGGWLWVILRGRDFARSAEWLFFLALVLTPMLHAWYFTWMIPFAVCTRNRGALAVTASGFVYFLLYHHVESPGGTWNLLPWESALLWLPYTAGFLWSALRHECGPATSHSQ